MRNDDIRYRLAELERLLANVIRLGAVEEADYATARVRVRSGQVLTAWLPWLTHRAGPDATWWAPEVGEQVALLAPGGDLAQAVVLPALYQVAHPAIADVPTKHRVQYADGASWEYDREAHTLRAYVPGNVIVLADGDVDVTVGGDATLIAGGDLDASVGGAASLTTGGDATVAAQGDISLSSPSRITLAAPIIALDGALVHGGGANGGGAQISGQLTQTGGGIVTDGDVVAAGVSLDHHTHAEPGAEPS
ncbi:MAG: phage baseplate assembly protein V [Desulfovibrionaceae bacterium]